MSVRETALRPVPWKTSDVVLGIILVVVAFAIAIILAVLAGPGEALALTIVGAASGLILVTTWIIGPVHHRVPLGTLGLRLPDSRGPFHLLLLPMLVVGASLAFVALYAGLLTLVGLDNFLPPSVPDEIVLDGPALIGSFAVVALLGPLAEEVFFRGFVLPGLRMRLGVPGALVTSSLIFALFHVDPRVMVPIFGIGILLAWLYHKTGSLWSCFVAHASFNALSLSVAVWA